MESKITFKQLEKLYATDPSRSKFISALQHFLYSKRETISQNILIDVPVYAGKPVDLYELFHQVDRREGFDKVNQYNKWQEVIDVMKLQTSPTALRDCYLKYLRLFEEAIKKKAQQSHLPGHPRPMDPSNAAYAPRPSGRVLDTPDQSSLPPQKRPRPEASPAPSPQQVPQQQTTHSSYPRPSIPRAQTLPSAPNPPTQTQNITTTSGTSSSIMVSPGHITAAIRSLYSSDQNSIKQGLNYLMQLSMEGDNARNILYVERFPSIIPALGNLLDTINPFTKILFSLYCGDLLDPSFDLSQHLLSDKDKYDIFWNNVNPLDHDNVLQAIARTLDTNTLLISALCIIRNLSFEANNVQMIAYSAPIMQHLVALLLVAACPTATAFPVAVPYLSRSRNPALIQASSYSLDTLYHIAKYIDITGSSRMEGSLEDCWLRDTINMNPGDRDSLKVSLTEHMSAISTGKYVAATAFLFPSLIRCITESYERDMTRRCLGILTKLTSVSSNTQIFAQKCPEKSLEQLVQLLCTNITSSESIRMYYPPGADANQYEAYSAFSSGLSTNLLDRLPAATGDFNEFSDIEIRDMVLDVLRGLCSHSDVNTSCSLSQSLPVHHQDPPEVVSLKERIASYPLCLNVLIYILSTSAGKINKSEGFHRALSLLSQLATHPKNHQKLLLIQKNLCFISMSDEVVAEAVMNSALRNIVQNTISYVNDIHIQEE